MGRIAPPLLGDKSKAELEKELTKVRGQIAENEKAHKKLVADEKALVKALQEK